MDTLSRIILCSTVICSILFEQITQIMSEYPEEALYQMPFAGAKGYHSKTLSYSINELKGDEIAEFSKQLHRWQLYSYAKDVLESTNQILLGLDYKNFKRKFGDDCKERLKVSKCVSEDENSIFQTSYHACGSNEKNQE